MRQSIFDYVGNLDTLIAVVVGAMLATTGALFAELIQDRLNRKRRERDAARFFGEILASIDRIIDFAIHSQKLGDPWGPVTRRLFRTAMREAGIYERNRERLFDLRDDDLRTKIHTHFLSETLPLETLLTLFEQLEELDSATLIAGEEAAHAARREELLESHERALKALLREHAKTPDLCRALESLGNIKLNFGMNAAQVTNTLDPERKLVTPEDV